MANYAVLKAAVEEVVKTNGNEEITGANLQSTLLSIINSLGTGYQFMGMATPSTTPPSSPDYNMAYIGGVGTYENFGTSVTVNVGSICVFKYNGTWTNNVIQVLTGIDTLPTENSTNLVESGGTLEFIRKTAKPLNDGLFVDYNHMLSVSSEIINYITDNSRDCIQILLPDNAVTIELTNITTSGRFYYFSSVEIKTETYLGSSATNAIPANARLAVSNCTHESNPNGYEATDVKLGIKLDDRIRTSTYDDVRYSANNFRLLLKSVISLTAGVPSISTSSSYDAVIVYIPPLAGRVSIVNASLNGNYLFFNSTEITEESYMGRNESGIVPQDAVMCVHNISRSDSASDYYKNVAVNITPSNIVNDTVDYYVREKQFTLIEPDTILENKRIWNGVIEDSTALDVYVYNNIVQEGNYAFSGKMSGSISQFYYITYWDENDNFLSYDNYVNVTGTGTEFDNMKLNIPMGAVSIKMNVQKSYSVYYELDSVILGDFYDFNSMENATNVPAPLKVVVNDDNSFYVRYQIDDENDGILVFDYLSHYNFIRNCIMISKYCVGGRNEIDASILAKQDYQHCADSQSPMFTANFGPLFSNHGYSIPRVVVQGNELSDSDIGSEWVDQNSYHYTIGKVSGNYIYLLPVIYSTGIAGQETRQWKWYSSPYPTQITRVGAGGETLTISSSSRWDLQVSQLSKVRVVINGKDVGAGTYQCEQVELAYEQIGYNPIFVNTWFPTPVYDGVMLKFDRHFTVTGGKGFLSATANTVLNNLYPYPLRHYIDVVPQFPFQIGDYKPYIYIPKMKKVTSDIDFREEFVSVDGSHSSVSYYRNTTDLVDVDDMPDRAYSYLKTDLGDVLYGCAGGHSLVRGMSVKSIRNNYISMNGEVGIWNPPAGNKHYNNILEDTNEENNIVPDTFINEFEGFMCWYKPSDDVHCFYHRSKDCYVVYIHTNKTFSKGYAILPDFMNNMGVESVVEKTDGIDLLTSTVVDGKLFFTSDNSIKEYNWVVVKVK